MKHLILYIILMVVPLSVWSQPDDMQASQETIVLKKGGRLVGSVIEIVPGKHVVFETLNGMRLTILDSDYRRIRTNKKGGIKNFPSIVENKFYQVSTAGTILNTVGESNGGVTGFELSAAVGYQYKKMIGGGIGIGADWYFPEGGEMIFPLFAEYRGYILDRRVSPYIAVRSGYGFAFPNEDIGIVSADGGFMFNPAIGWRFGGISHSNFVVDLGMKFQKASFEYRRDSDRSDVDLIYRRLNLRFGVLF